jgi:multicomponent Na+:H+ antiporter subunit E
LQSMYFRLGSRFLGYYLLWWILTEAYPGAWRFGLPVVLLALLANWKMRKAGAWRWRLAGFGRFFPFFLWQSLRGGIDVARRAIDPRLPLAPGFFEHRLRLPSGPSRIFLADTISLLPGTCSVSLEREEFLEVHVLDEAMPIEQSLRRLEERIALLFGLDLAAEPSGGKDE